MPTNHSFENEFTGICFVILNAMFRRMRGIAANRNDKFLDGIVEKVSVCELGCDAYKHIVFIFFMCVGYDRSYSCRCLLLVTILVLMIFSSFIMLKAERLQSAISKAHISFDSHKSSDGRDLRLPIRCYSFAN